MKGWVRWAEVWHHYEEIYRFPVTECGREPPDYARNVITNDGLSGVPCSRCVQATHQWRKELADRT